MDKYVCDNCNREFKSMRALSMHKVHKSGKHPGWDHINSDINRRSFPEKFMLQVFKENEIFSKYTIIEKMPFSKYYLDFAFVETKVCVEVDGQQHYRDLESINHDKERDEFLNSHGWKIYRINWVQFCNDTKNEINELLGFLSNSENQSNRFYSIEDLDWRQKPKYGNREQYFKSRKEQYLKSQLPIVEKLLNNDIDFSKNGWVENASKIIGIKPQKVSDWMKRNIPDFYEKYCYKRKATHHMRNSSK